MRLWIFLQSNHLQPIYLSSYIIIQNQIITKVFFRSGKHAITTIFCYYFILTHNLLWVIESITLHMYEPNRLIFWSESPFYVPAGMGIGIPVVPYRAFIEQSEQVSKDAHN